jgi:hypothetical protein
MSETDPTPEWRLVSTIGALRAALSPRDPVPPLLRIGAQALKEALLGKLPEREERILATAEELARSSLGSPKVALQAYAYLALVGCGLARDAAAPGKTRAHAVVAAVAFSVLSTENACSALGVDERLTTLAQDESLGSELRAIATLTARHTYPKDLIDTLDRWLEPPSVTIRKPQVG